MADQGMDTSVKASRGGGLRATSGIQAAGNVDAVLAREAANMGPLGAPRLVSALHSIAKLSQAGAFGKVGSMQGLRRDFRFRALVATAQELCQDVDTPGLIMQLLSALAKVGAQGDDVSFIVTHVSNVAPEKPLSTCLSFDPGRRAMGHVKLSHWFSSLFRREEDASRLVGIEGALRTNLHNSEFRSPSVKIRELMGMCYAYNALAHCV
eukprot:TRINITY_DN23460_c0_g1_i3.p1 TRINITY_DN23460_c0_g1~~TRINITY_DN23460_c0_g1_i3.p1  ORF type:complete len:209 (-),score=21.54 TRINITY_DN23460_c0_g1_i3:154-780(-)